MRRISQNCSRFRPRRLTFSTTSTLSLRKLSSVSTSTVSSSQQQQQPLPTTTIAGLSNELLQTLSMNYGNDGTTHEELTKNLKKNGLIKTQAVFDAFLQADRKSFLPKLCNTPYTDKPQKIGCGATITAPHMHAVALEALAPFLKKGATVLDVGSGSGYLTACFALLVGEEGKAFGLDHAIDLVRQAGANVYKGLGFLHDSGRISFKAGDGSNGWVEKAPFDCIHVGAAVEKVPENLFKQLKIGGRLLLPILSPNKSGEQDLTLIEKTSENLDSCPQEKLMKVVFSLLETGGPSPSVAGAESITTAADPVLEVNKVIEELEKEAQENGEKIKAWQADFKSKNDRKPSLKDYRASHVGPLLERNIALTKQIEKRKHLRSALLKKQSQEKLKEISSQDHSN